MGQIVVAFDKTFSDGKAYFSITLTDDGRGIDPEKIRQVLLKTMPQTYVSSLTDHQLIQHVFDSGLTTKETVTDLSGRGVGMDAIRYAVQKLGGTVMVESVINKGTSTKLILPWLEQMQNAFESPIENVISRLAS